MLRAIRARTAGISRFLFIGLAAGLFLLAFQDRANADCSLYSQNISDCGKAATPPPVRIPTVQEVGNRLPTSGQIWNEVDRDGRVALQFVGFMVKHMPARIDENPDEIKSTGPEMWTTETTPSSDSVTTIGEAQSNNPTHDSFGRSPFGGEPSEKFDYDQEFPSAFHEGDTSVVFREPKF